jgi:hypothetical protein
MTTRAFYFFEPVGFEVLGHVIAGHFGVPAHEVLVFDDMRHIDAPFEDTPGGPLWQEWEVARIRVYVEMLTDVIGPLAGWFAIETESPVENTFEDLPVARAVGAASGQVIVFRDPVPDPYDSPYVEAAQIAVDPDGEQTEMWLVEYGETGQSRMELIPRADVFPERG